MPDLFEQPIPASQLPPPGPRPVFRDNNQRGNPTPPPEQPSTPPAPEAAPGLEKAPSKPAKLDHPEYARIEIKFKPGDSERARPLAVTIGRNKLATINTEGVIGDLDPEGIDLLAGYIARINGVGFILSSAHDGKNPGGFGLTLRAGNSEPFTHLLPILGSADVPKWMIPMIDDLQKSLKTPNPLVFPSWAQGGGALIDYLNLIRVGKIPYFFRGPLTPIAEVLLCYESPFCTDQTFAWSKLQKHLEEAAQISDNSQNKN